MATISQIINFYGIYKIFFALPFLFFQGHFLDFSCVAIPSFPLLLKSGEAGRALPFPVVDIIRLGDYYKLSW